MNSGIYLWLAGLSKTLLEGAFYTQGTLIKAVLKGVCSAPPPPSLFALVLHVQSIRQPLNSSKCIIFFLGNTRFRLVRDAKEENRPQGINAFFVIFSPWFRARAKKKRNNKGSRQSCFLCAMSSLACPSLMRDN